MIDVKIAGADNSTERKQFDDVHDAINFIEEKVSEDHREWIVDEANEKLVLIDDNHDNTLFINEIHNVEHPRRALTEHDGWTTVDFTWDNYERKVAEIEMEPSATVEDYEELLDFCIQGIGQQSLPFEIDEVGREGEGRYAIYRVDDFPEQR